MWAGDGSASLLMGVEKHSRGPGGGDNLIIEFSALRAVDLATRQVREIARISGQNRNRSLFPLAWLPARGLAATLELGSLGQVVNYVRVRGSAVERTDVSGFGGSAASFTASRDGERVAGTIGYAVVRWWPVDAPAAAKIYPRTRTRGSDTSSFGRARTRSA